MGLFDWIKGASEEVVSDPEMGRMRHENDRWIVSTELDGLEAPIDVMLMGGRTGPDPAVREAFFSLKARFRELFEGPVADDLYEIELNNTSADETSPPPNRAQVFDVYRLESISIACPEGSILVDLAFNHVASQDHHVYFHLVDWRPAGISVDS